MAATLQNPLGIHEQALLVRMLMRRGPWFRASHLRYDEVGDAVSAAAPLLAAGFLADQQPLGLDALFALHTKAELLVQLDEQLAALDEQIRELQRGGAPAALGASLRKAAELAVERKRLADERDRLAGGMAQAESPELEPEDGRRRGPRR